MIGRGRRVDHLKVGIDAFVVLGSGAGLVNATGLCDGAKTRSSTRVLSDVGG